jgi:hypothetical protein
MSPVRRLKVSCTSEREAEPASSWRRRVKRSPRSAASVGFVKRRDCRSTAARAVARSASKLILRSVSSFLRLICSAFAAAIAADGTYSSVTSARACMSASRRSVVDRVSTARSRADHLPTATEEASATVASVGNSTIARRNVRIPTRDRRRRRSRKGELWASSTMFALSRVGTRLNDSLTQTMPR